MVSILKLETVVVQLRQEDHEFRVILSYLATNQLQTKGGRGGIKKVKAPF